MADSFRFTRPVTMNIRPDVTTRYLMNHSYVFKTIQSNRTPQASQMM